MGKDKNMCYYMGVGDKEMDTAGGVKREISASLGRGINAKRLCTRLKSKDAQMGELRYEKKIDVKNVDLKKLRVKELRISVMMRASAPRGSPRRTSSSKRSVRSWDSRRRCRFSQAATYTYLC